MSENIRSGIVAGGNWIVDQIKMIDDYPVEERLVTICNERNSSGGAPFNVLKALDRMGASFPLEGVGVIGNDGKAKDILRECTKAGINTRQIKKIQGASTSYTDVMTTSSTGKRTFFHYRGANALLDESCFDFTHTNAKIFHLGYLLLLDGLDEMQSNGLTGAANVFKRAKRAGLMTSADIVSEQSKRSHKVVSSSLPFIDILFLNEFEAQMLTKIGILDQGEDTMLARCYRAAEKIIDMGVQGWVVIHFSRGAVALSNKGHKIWQQAINIPPDKVKGTVGAGDGLAAGVLYGIHENWDMQKSLLLGVSVAAASLMDVTSSDSIRPWQECMGLGEKYEFRKNKNY